MKSPVERGCGAGVKRLRHPLAGELDLPYEAMELSADSGLRLNVYTPEPDSVAHERLTLIASWSDSSHTTA